MTLLEAVRSTLTNDPNIQLFERQVDVAKGVSESASGQFDASLVSSLAGGVTRLPRSETDRNLGGFPDVLTTVDTLAVYRAGITNQFRSGISAYVGIELDHLTDNLFQTEPANRADVSFVLRVPLLRGAGRAAVDAQERAARLGQEAAVLDLQQTVATRIFNTASAYWNCRGAVEQLVVLSESKGQASALVEVVQALVGIGEMTGSDLLQARADEAQKTAALSAGEQTLWQAQQDLAQAIGLPVGNMPRPPLATDRFPPLDTNTVEAALENGNLIVRSLERRGDYQSSLKAQDAARILEVAARKNAKPQLDLNLEAGYAGLNEGNGVHSYFASLDPTVVSGPHLFGTLSLEWPIKNRVARGLVVQRTAEEQQTRLRSQSLERTIQAGILVALKDVRNSLLALQKSQEAQGDYRRAVTQEEDKLRLRTSTILDLITLKDRWEAAQLSEVAATARYWIALARCRYETGWMVRPGATPESPLTVESIITLPPVNQEDATKPMR
jgi:outer membrane protein TolC